MLCSNHCICDFIFKETQGGFYLHFPAGWGTNRKVKPVQLGIRQHVNHVLWLESVLCSQPPLPKIRLLSAGSAADPAWRLTPGCLSLPGGRALGSVQIGRFALGMGLPPPDLEIVDRYEGLSVCQQRSPALSVTWKKEQTVLSLNGLLPILPKRMALEGRRSCSPLTG